MSLRNLFTHTATVRRKVDAQTITLASVVAGQTVTINTLVFTAHGTTTTKSTRRFSVSGDNVADAGQLLACINDADYGVPGVTATRSGAILTLTGSAAAPTVTISASATTFTISTTDAHGQPLKTWVNWITDEPCLHAMVTGSETKGGTQAAIGDYRTWFYPNIDITSDDKLIITGGQFATDNFEVYAIDRDVMGRNHHAEAVSKGVNV